MKKLVIACAILVLAGCTAEKPKTLGAHVGNPDFTCKDAICRFDVPVKKNPSSGQCEYDSSYTADHTIAVTKADTVIVWRLPQDYRFCTQLGDGVWLKEDYADFDDGWATDDDDGAMPAGHGKACRKNFSWKDSKTTINPGSGTVGTFSYRIQFHTQNAKKACDPLDPFVLNQ